MNGAPMPVRTPARKMIRRLYNQSSDDGIIKRMKSLQLSDSRGVFDGYTTGIRGTATTRS
ncbi:protein of unknown function [Paraburkholderia dioscoreae]|uniref:Uncharacterized protein n=1 Tax=Paraburkholderia dioscoreae TaxID=2604047 RepID=A0A5Q4ZP88_9BURK|nr:protein of unknown function [Paraburkholderia dioscoreae]